MFCAPYADTMSMNANTTTEPTAGARLRHSFAVRYGRPEIQQAAARIRYARNMGMDLILMDDAELGLEGLTDAEVEQAYSSAEVLTANGQTLANGRMLGD